MNWFELFYVCMKPSKVPEPKCEAAIENVNVCITNERLTGSSITNERLTDGSINYSESCNSIISELSTIDE